MKLKIIAVATIIFMLLGVQVCATAYEYNIELPEGYAVATADSEHSQVAERLDMMTEELHTFFNDNEILYLAVSEDLKTQVRLSAFTDNYSSAVNNISYLDSEKLEEFKNTVFGEGSGEIIDLNGTAFITSAKTLEDSGGEYTVTQYITICGGKTYYLSCYNDGTATSEEIKKIVESFTLTETEKNDSSFFITSRILIFAGIVLFGILAIIMIIGTIKLVRSKDGEEN